MDPHDTTRPTRPDVPRATAPPTRTFGPQGPTLGDLIDAYLQDYQVRQFRSHSTARGRTAHLTAFFGRDARATALTTQFDIRTFADVRYTAGAQTMGQPTTPPAGDLICVFVRLNKGGYGADRFYVLPWPELQRVLINGYRGYLERHGGRRPKRADSFHTALRETPIEPFLDNWSLFDAFM